MRSLAHLNFQIVQTAFQFAPTETLDEHNKVRLPILCQLQVTTPL